MAGPVPMPITCLQLVTAALLLAVGSAKVRRAINHAILLIIAHKIASGYGSFARRVVSMPADRSAPTSPSSAGHGSD